MLKYFSAVANEVLSTLFKCFSSDIVWCYLMKAKIYLNIFLVENVSYSDSLTIPIYNKPL